MGAVVRAQSGSGHAVVSGVLPLRVGQVETVPRRAKAPPSTRAADEGSTKAVTQACIAVIEDDADIREAIVELLEEASYRVLEYADARVALSALDRGERPDLILLDLMMPTMDGWAFRVEQRKRPDAIDIPVIAISADVSPKAAAIHADAYIAKPFDAPQLIALVGQVLSASERRKTIFKAAELERLRSLGMMVATVAHEVNNPLTGVTGYLDVCSRLCERGVEQGLIDPKLAREVENALAAAQDGAERVASVVQNLLSFARGPEQGAPAVADPVRAIEAAISLALPQLRQKAQLEREYGELPRVRMNEAQLAQVLLNLLVNAAQALSAESVGPPSIVVRAMHDRERVTIEISDNGRGIAPTLMQRIFQPFFSTKPSGQGTGLGLSISRDLVTTAGGSIEVSSELGKGATFRVHVPLAWEAVSGPVSTGPSEATIVPRKCCRVLVLDDDPLVGKMLERMLEGHQVSVFEEPERALAALQRESFDVIMCDWWMPTIKGEDFYAWLQAVRPALTERFVLMTGAASSHELEAFIQKLDGRVLRKPFDREQIERMVPELAGEPKVQQ